MQRPRATEFATRSGSPAIASGAMTPPLPSDVEDARPFEGRRARLAVYLGSRFGTRPEYTEAARTVGESMVVAGFDLVYGGGSVGLMGVVADAVRSAGGSVTGVITEQLMSHEVGHGGLDELIVTPDMPSRKAIMFERADAFIALPGGVGTLEELFEVVCWSTLDLHPHPVGLLNTEDFYTPLIAMFDHLDTEGFLRRDRLDVTIEADPVRLIDTMAQRVRDGG